MKRPKLCSATVLIVLTAAPDLRADWYCDFDDGKIPDLLLIGHNFGPHDPPVSETLSESAEDGYLEIVDPTQNHAFEDNQLPGIKHDLSEILFISREKEAEYFVGAPVMTEQPTKMGSSFAMALAFFSLSWGPK